MNMQKDNTPVTYRPKPKSWQRIRSSLCTGILIFTLAVAGILAIPACLFIGLIGFIWSTADKLVKALER